MNCFIIYSLKFYMLYVKKKVYFSLFFLIFFSANIYSQNNDSSSLLYKKIYFSLEETKNCNPEDICSLNLRKQKLTEFPEEIFNFKNLWFLTFLKIKLK